MRIRIKKKIKIRRGCGLQAAGVSPPSLLTSRTREELWRVLGEEVVVGSADGST